MLQLIARVAALAACAVLVLLALHDLRRRRLPNALVATVGALYFLFALGKPQSLAPHLVLGLVFLSVALLLSVCGVMGGGDAKLIGALMCWAGPEQCLRTWVIATQTGLVLALLGVAARALLRRQAGQRVRPVLRCLTAGRGVPYGVALAVGGLCAIAAQTG